MQGLGNEAVLDKVPLRLRDPHVANDLLDLLIEKDRARRRAIFFCAYETPRKDGER
jgi:hypothetical protein